MTMTKKSRTKAIARGSVLVALLCCGMLIPAAGASASSKSIKQAIKAYLPKLNVAEGHVTTAVGEYEQNKNPAPVEEALGASVKVVTELEAKVAAQHAGSPRVKRAKAKILAGLRGIVLAYQHLGSAFADSALAPATAKSEAEKSLRAIRHGSRELDEGLKLLKHA